MLRPASVLISSGVAPAGIGDENVYCNALAAQKRDDLRRGVRRRKVYNENARGRSARPLKVCRETLKAISATRDKNKVCPLPRQLVGERRSDACGCASDKRGPPARRRHDLAHPVNFPSQEG
jgi:hypothetical protein